MRDWDWTDWLPWVVTVIVTALCTALIVWAVNDDTPRDKDRGTLICQPMLVGKVIVPFCYEAPR